MDYKHWRSIHSQGLWLAGPPERNLDQVASHIIDLERSRTSITQHYVLFFFCVTAGRQKPITKALVSALLQQLILSAPALQQKSIIATFLRVLFDAIPNTTVNTVLSGLEGAPLNRIIQNIWDITAGTNSLEGLKTVLELEQLDIQELSIIIHGLDRPSGIQSDMTNSASIREVCAFIVHLHERPGKVAILLTSRPQDEVKVLLKGVPSIEYDKERKGLMMPHQLLT
jgi:hypothetical protein